MINYLLLNDDQRIAYDQYRKTTHPGLVSPSVDFIQGFTAGFNAAKYRYDRENCERDQIRYAAQELFSLNRIEIMVTYRTGFDDASIVGWSINVYDDNDNMERYEVVETKKGYEFRKMNFRQ